MRLLLQRVSSASVSVNGEVVGEIGNGVVLFVGATDGDTGDDATYLAQKVANLRIFPDDEGQMNVSLLDSGGAALVVSQFTLYADVRKGRRPSFVRAARPEVAEPLVDNFARELESLGLRVESGAFGAHMDVALVNDGPVTIWFDSEELRSRN
ncbi:MAG: D-aminoacyl-tRNA deacylase [Chloroflexota bacterium]